MALTLMEARKLVSGDVVRSGVIELFARSSPLLSAIPFIDIPGGSYHYTQEGTLPGVAFRGINQGYTASTGIVVPQVEVLRIAGGDLDVDKALIKMHGAGIRSTQEMMKVKALSLMIGKKFIKGDSTTDPLEFDGLQNRITGNQLIDAGSTNGGDPLSLAKLDEAIDAVDFPTHLIMNKAMVRRLTAAARNSSIGGFITSDIDELGRKVTKYNDLPILDIEHDEAGAKVLSFNETGSGGATATATSIYVVSFSEGMCVGLQNGIMDVTDLGEVDDSPVLRTRVDWLVGFATMHPRCAARIRGISDAAVVA